MPEKPPNPAGKNGEVGFSPYQRGQSRGCRSERPDGTGLQPSGSWGKDSWGVAPGWDGAARWALRGRILGRRVLDGMGRAFSPPVHGGMDSWGVAPGWDGAARWALRDRVFGTVTISFRFNP